MDSVEQWRPVVDFEGTYEVSNQGRVRSLDRVIEHFGKQGRRFQTTRKGQLLANCPHSAGYHQVWVRNAKIPGQKRRKAFVHILVARAFLGEPPTPEMEVCHWDGDPANNRLSNLRWDTVSANKLDMVRQGTHNETRKVSCKYGHLFTGPNLVFKRGTNGRITRKCVSCKYAHGRVGNNPSRNERDEADRYYLTLGLGAPKQLRDGVDERPVA